MTGARLLLHQTRFDLLAFSRSRESRFFTVVLPIIFLVIFATVFGNDTTTVNGREIKQTTYYVPNLIALGVVGAALTNLAIGVVMQREEGVLKRRRATPVGPWAQGADRDRRLLWDIRRADARRPRDLRRGRPDHDDAGRAGHHGRGSGSALLLRLCHLDVHQVGGGRDARAAGDRAPAVLHLRLLHPLGSDPGVAAAHRRRLPVPAARPGAADGVRPGDDRLGVQARIPGGDPRLGRRRPGRGVAPLLVVAEGVLSGK